MGSFGAGSVPTKEGQRSAPKRGAGRQGWSFGLWLVALECALEEVKAQSPARERWSAVGCVGLAVVFGFGSLRWLCGLEEVKAKSSAKAGWVVPKIPKIPVIPVIVDDNGQSNDNS